MKPGIDKLSEYAFLDFEACALGVNSWPIEIGVSYIAEDGEIKTWSSLIMRHATWLPEFWSEHSEAVHNIPFMHLDAAPPAEDVWSAAQDVIGGRKLVSDYPKFDGYWLHRLIVAAGADPEAVELHDFHETAGNELFSDLYIDRVYEYLTLHRAPHRAGPDSRRLAEAVMHPIIPAHKRNRL